MTELTQHTGTHTRGQTLQRPEVDGGARAGEGRGRETLTGTECQFEKVLEMDGGDGGTTMKMDLVPLNRTVKYG